MPHRIIALLVLMCTPVTAVEIVIPDDIAEMVRYEQRHNVLLPQGKTTEGLVAIMRLPPMPEEHRKPFKIFYWNVPRIQIGENKIFTSRYADEPLLNFVAPKQNGKDRADVDAIVRDYVPEVDSEELRRHREDHGREPDGFIYGVRIQGRWTAIAWDPANPDGRKWQLKFAAKLPNPAAGEGAYVRCLGFQTIQRAIHMSEVVEDILATEGGGSLVGALPERFGVSIGEYGYVAREMEYVGFQHEPGTAFAVPLHGFLSEEGITISMVVSEYKRRNNYGNKGMLVWIGNEFIPKLAAFVAQLQLYLGILPELHTQNVKLVLEMDPETQTPTGNILGFIFTDMTDTAVDPSVRVIFGRHSYLPELSRMRSPNIMNQKVMGEEELADHATSMRAFLSQTLGSAYFLSLVHGEDVMSKNRGFFEDWEANLYQLFLNQYLEIATGWLGELGCKLNPEFLAFKELLGRELVVAAPPAITNGPQIPGMECRLTGSKGSSGISLIAFMTSTLVRELVQMVLSEQIIAQFRAKRIGQSGARSPLRDEFLERLKARHVTYVDLAYSKDPELPWLNDPLTKLMDLPRVGIVAYQEVKHQGRKLPLTMAIAVDPKQQNPILNCSSALQQVVWSNSHIPESIKLLRFLSVGDEALTRMLDRQ